MSAARRSTIRSLAALSRVRAFRSEDDERDWWARHDLSEDLYNKLEPPTTELDRLRNKRASNGLIRLEIEGPPPVYGAALSLLSPKHPHANRVAALRAKAKQTMGRRGPIHEPIVMAVSQVYTERAMADAANIIGAVSNALEGIVYANDRLIREAHFRSRRGTRSSYTVIVRSIA